MKNLRLFGTGATIATFALIGATGVLLFLGFRFANLKSVHEYVGVMMVLACLAHIAANWRAFLNYFKGATGVILALLIAAGTAAVAIDFGAKKGAPAVKKVYFWAQELSLEKAVATFGADRVKFEKFLEGRGLKFENISIKEFAAKNGASEDEILSALLPNPKK